MSNEDDDDDDGGGGDGTSNGVSVHKEKNQTVGPCTPHGACLGKNEEN